MKRRVLGIEIGGSKIQIVTGNTDGVIRQRDRFSVEPEKGAQGIRNKIAAALPDLLKTEKPTAIGVGFGGPVDRLAGRVWCSHQIEGWADFPLAEWLDGLTGLPVCVENDANAAALAESSGAGAGAGADSVFYVTLGSGVGGGLVAGGKLFHGAPPGEAEIGHIRLDRTGLTVEERCSGWAVDERIRSLKKVAPKSALVRMASKAKGGEARFLAAAVAEKDQWAMRIIEETGEHLAFALSHVTHLLSPQVIVLGGGLSLTGEPLRKSVAAALPRFLMEAMQPGPEVRLAKLGEEAVPVGALILAGEAG